PEDRPEYWERAIAALPREQAPAILGKLSSRLARSDHEILSRSAPFVAETARLFGVLSSAKGSSDLKTRHRIAEVLEQRAEILEVMLGRLQDLPGYKGSAKPARLRVSQDVLVARLLRAESLGHVSALVGEFQDLESVRSELPVNLWIHQELAAPLDSVLETIEEIGRLPSAEDRALYLGQALSLTLSAHEQLAARRAAPSIPLEICHLVLESLRQLLATALQDIQQRAELKAVLRSKVVTTRREAVVVLELENVGQGHARNVAVELQPGEQFHCLRNRREVRSLLRRQAARLEFLVEPRVSDRVRLGFVITYDDLERQGHRREFADVVEFRQVGANRTFVPLRPNPYVVGRPLLASDVFLGREDVFARLEASLRGAHQDNVVVLRGARRMGKTSILRRMHVHLGDGYAPVLIDLQGMIGSGESAFFRELAATVCDELEELGVEAPEPAAEIFERDPGSAFRRKFLRKLAGRLGERRLLLMLDEFEVLEARIRRGDLEPRILPYFRSLMQHEKNVSFIFAGTHRLDELTHDYWGVLFNLAIYLEVGHLPETRAKELFVEPTRGHFIVDPLALDKAFQLTGGHPHFSQLLARELVEYRNEERLSYVTIQDVNVVACRVVEKGQLHISYLWEECSRDERLLLLALGELLDRKGMATLGSIESFLAQRRLEPIDSRSATRRLGQREILGDNAGLLSFRMELLRLWLDRHHGLESSDIFEGRGPHPDQTTEGRERRGDG
ncbi:MAG: ATP-binding protein, partial [Holophagales bacterium]|nr:ATP-binding protein [Holophagales bacterium]